MDQKLWYPTGSTAIAAPDVKLIPKGVHPGPISLGHIIRHPKQILDPVNLREIIPLEDLMPNGGPLVKKQLKWDKFLNSSKQGSGGVTAPVAPAAGVTVESSAEMEIAESAEDSGRFRKVMCLQFQPTAAYIEEVLETISVTNHTTDEAERRRFFNLKVPHYTNDWELWMVIGLMWVTAGAQTSTTEINLHGGGAQGNVGVSGLAQIRAKFKSKDSVQDKIHIGIHAHDYVWAVSYMRLWQPHGEKWRKEVVTGNNAHFGKPFTFGAGDGGEESTDGPEGDDKFGIAYLPDIDIKLVKWVE
ncbi:hypothetical protein QBC44DRAFT_372561 [Cladorrhinum sp. PSN332]|nr:hypothetical protein QBC44DRAFT_372561 [Cladorrhinum sp. PSN332]